MSLDNNPEVQSEAKKKRKSLRGHLGLPIGGIMFASPQFTGYEGGGDGGGLGEDQAIFNEMIQVAKDLQETIKKSGKPYEVYDIEEAGIPLYTAQFEPNMHDKEIGSFPNNEEKKFVAHVKNPETNKIVQIPYANPVLNIEPIKQSDPLSPKQPKKKKGDALHRGWASKYWSTVPIKRLIAEIINPDEIDVATLKFNDELNPLLWEGDKLKEDVRNQLLKIAAEFIKSCKIEDYKYNDIVFVGSMANYTYTPQSDIDVHIVCDFSQFKAEEEILGEYFTAKKDLWANNHDIKINGHSVECYVQNSNEPYTSLGVYSLMKDEWVREPLKKMISVDEGNIQLKAAHFMNAIDKLEERLKNGEDVVNELKKVKDKIKAMRKNGLYKEGEYSTENLVFKVLRNSGYLQKLINLKNNNMDQNLSL